MSVDSKKYLEELRRHFSNCEPGYIRQRLINIDLDHIIPDELHLLLRITDRLIENLISGAIANDNVSNILEGTMLKNLVQEIRSCGVTFNIFAKSRTNTEFTSLTGSDRKKLLKFLPPKIQNCQPAKYGKEVAILWEVSKQTCQIKLIRYIQMIVELRRSI